MLPVFTLKTAPVSGVQSLMDYDVTFIGDICHGEIATSVKVVVPATSLCRGAAIVRQRKSRWARRWPAGLAAHA